MIPESIKAACNYADSLDWTVHFCERMKERFRVSDFYTHLSLIKFQFNNGAAEQVQRYRYLVFVKGYPAIVVVIDNVLITIFHACKKAN
jgi:hypothetical protein